ncbi:unnamed protein product [Rhizophagus irregularis]|nr:unnamed protein product [Rhizophagus irregularis]
MAELRDQVSQYIGFEPNEIRLPITEDNRWLFRKIIADQEGIGNTIMDDYRFLLQHGHNGKGGNQIDIGWLFAFTVAQAKKVLISPPEHQAERDLSEKILAHIEKRFEEVPLAPLVMPWVISKASMKYATIGDINELATTGIANVGGPRGAPSARGIAWADDTASAPPSLKIDFSDCVGRL